MRTALLAWLMMSLLLLPFTGGTGAAAPWLHASAITSAHQANAELAVVEAEPHCELMARLHALSTSSADSKHTTATPDCCDEAMECGWACPADCGHCGSFGHGSNMISAVVHPTHSAIATHSIAYSKANYSLLLAAPTKPPIIA